MNFSENKITRFSSSNSLQALVSLFFHSWFLNDNASKTMEKWENDATKSYNVNDLQANINNKKESFSLSVLHCDN